MKFDAGPYHFRSKSIVCATLLFGVISSGISICLPILAFGSCPVSACIEVGKIDRKK